MDMMLFTNGDAQNEPNGVWMYVLEWLSRSGAWVAYGMDTRYGSLKADVIQLERLGYYRDRRRVRHWFKETSFGDVPSGSGREKSIPHSVPTGG